MANYFLTETAQFKPFSYQEMLAPVKAYQDAYNALETEMSNLDILANSIKNKLNPNDPEDAKKLKEYEAFQSEMDSAMNSFYNKGYNSDTRKKLNVLKVQYAKELDPINQAYERRIKDADFIRQHRMTNPNLIVEGVGSSTSAYMYGNTPSPTVVNLNTVSDAAKNASAGLSKQFVEQIGLQSVEGYIGRYLMNGVKRGIDSNMVSEFTNYVDSIKNDKTGQLKTPQGLALYNMFEQIRTANNYDKLSQTGKDRLDASIIQGLVSGAATDEDIKYIADNYWDVQAKQASINYTKARMQALRDKNNSGNGSTNLDLRTNTTLYTGKNFDVAKIADLMGEQFKEPIEHNGTKIYDPIQAYNIIHKDDARIAELQSVYDAKKEQLNKKISIDPSTGERLTLIEKIMSDPDAKLIHDELDSLKMRKIASYRALEGVALTDKEAARIREYVSNRENEAVKTIKAQLENPSVYITDAKGNLITLESADSSSIVYSNNEQNKELTKLIPFYNLIKKHTSVSNPLITPEEMEVFATLAASDLSTGNVAEKRILVFDKANSKSGLSDALTTLSRNMNDVILNKGELDIVDVNNKPVKPKKINELYKDGVLDSEKILGIELDFNSAVTGRIRLNTTKGIFYISGNYLGDQANNFINGISGIKNEYNKQMSNYMISKGVKAANLNTSLHAAADAIQEQFSLNRDQEQPYTISNTDLKKIIQYLAEEE